MNKQGTILAGVILTLALMTAPVFSGSKTTDDLTALSNKYGCLKGPKGHNFTPIYDLYFAPIRSQVKRIFEIGIEYGYSAKMFRDYFPNATIFAIDIVDCSKFNSDRIKTYIADQANKKQLQGFINTHGSDFDIILDDGGHAMDMQQISLAFLFPHLKSGGLYVLEDVHTSFYPKEACGAEPDGSNTTYRMITDYMKMNGRIISKYMTQAEEDYITANIEYCSLVNRNNGKSLTWIVKKK